MLQSIQATCLLCTLQTREQKPTQSTHGLRAAKCEHWQNVNTWQEHSLPASWHHKIAVEQHFLL
jgi:hypothetical protein